MTVLVAVAAGLPPGGTFVDDDGSVHETSIEAIAAAEITRGCNPPANNRFCPKDVVTRGQMAAFLSRALGLGASQDDHFLDDGGHLFEESINRLAQARITFGCNPPINDRFCPNQPMTRGAMAAMLVRAFGYPAVDQDYFIDDEVGVFEADINSLAAARVTLGCNPPANTRFCPSDLVTREAMATFMTRALNLTPLEPPPRTQAAVVIEPRESWGARAANISRLVPHSVTELTVHHAGTQAGSNGPVQFRRWQNWHLDGQGWGDIAYHVIIGVDGAVYEGRDPSYQGDTGTSYDTAGHFLVVVEGNFDVERPTSAQVEALVDVLAAAVAEYGVEPSTITGHRDHATTTCPGDNLAALLDSGEIVRAVEQRLDDGGAELVWP